MKQGNSTRKWLNKYCKCDKTHFELTDEGVKHKGVLFLRFKGENERVNLLNLLDDGYDYLNDKWNFFMSIND